MKKELLKIKKRLLLYVTVLTVGVVASECGVKEEETTPVVLEDVTDVLENVNVKILKK